VRLDSGDGRKLEIMDVNVDRVPFRTAVCRIRNFKGPLLARIQINRRGHRKFVLELVVDAEVDADNWILLAGEEPSED
jgi:hypothetical protein